MASKKVSPSKNLKGTITPPADKSISHRSIMLGSLATGKSVVRNFLKAADTLSTVGAFRSLGVDISVGDEVVINGVGLHGLKEAAHPIDCGNSGTTMRLIAGILSGNPMFSVLVGDESLSTRPMGRVAEPLRLMGAEITGYSKTQQYDGRAPERIILYPPLAIRGGNLKGMRYELPVPSAQVKSAILLAGLYAEGVTEVVEKVRSRDHSERMLPACGADLEVDGLTVRIRGGAELKGGEFIVPADFSSAAFFIAAAVITQGSELLIKSVNMNATRTGLLDVLKAMGADITISNETTVAGEPIADLVCRSSSLRAATFDEALVPSMIDEVPILAVLAACAEGTTVIRGAAELRVKETDRIKTISDGLRAMGVRVEEFPDGLAVTGGPLKGATVQSAGDHRIAMSLAVAGLVADGETTINGSEAVDISFPGFFDMLRSVAG